MIQYVLVGLLLLWAVYFIVNMIKKQFQNKNACASNCKCGIEFDQINSSSNQ